MKKRTLSNLMSTVGIIALIVLLAENWTIGVAVFFLMWSNNCVEELKEK